MNRTDDVPPGFSGRSDCVAALRRAIEQAAECRVMAMCWVDRDFADWPLDEVDLLATLTAWASQPKRRLLILAQSYDEILRRFPRFVLWRRRWAHAVQCQLADEVDAAKLPTLLLAGERGVQWIDRLRFRGRWLTDAAELRVWREQTDAILQRSAEAFPSTTLGL